MGLKESGLRGSLRNVSVGIVAIPDSVVDNFEDGDLSEYDGDLDAFSVQDNVVFDGEFALEKTIEDGTRSIGSTDGLDNYIEVGDLFEFRHNWSVDPTDNGLQSWFAFGGDVTNGDPFENSFYLQLQPRSDEVRIAKRQDDEFVTLASVSNTTWPIDSWTRVEGSWANDGTITMIYEDASGDEIASLTATDTDFQDNFGVGYFTNSESSTDDVVYLDEVLVAKGGV